MENQLVKVINELPEIKGEEAGRILASVITLLAKVSDFIRERSKGL